MTEQAVIFRASITVKGRKIYASSYGLRTFPIPLPQTTAAQEKELDRKQKGENSLEKE